MSKPVANLNEVEFTDIEDNGYYTSKRAQFSAGIVGFVEGQGHQTQVTGVGGVIVVASKAHLLKVS
jgi:hypothetical protein